MSLTNKKESASEPKFEVLTNENRPVPVGADRGLGAEDEIDLLELAYVLLDKLHYIILCFLAGAVLFNAVAFFLIQPTYQSVTKLYVVSASNDSVVDLTDLNIGTSLTSDYEQLILSDPVLEQVISDLKLDMEVADLANMITLENPADTRILNITVTSTDPQEAKTIANKVAEVAIEYLPKTMNTNPPNIAQSAKLADKKAGPSYSKYTLMGALLGAVLCCAYLIVMHLLDDTIHSAEDMDKYFGIVLLTTIPDSDIFGTDEDEKEERKFGFRKGFRKG